MLPSRVGAGRRCLAGLVIACAWAGGAVAGTRPPLEAGRAYELLLAVVPVTTLQVEVVELVDDCWVRVRHFGGAGNAAAGFPLWNACEVLAIRRLVNVGDVLVIEARAVLSLDEEALDRWVMADDERERREIAATGRVRVLPLGTKVEILRRGERAHQVRVLDGALEGSVGIMYGPDRTR